MPPAKSSVEDLSGLPKVAGLEVSPVADTLQHFKILLYGDPGVGKTVLAGSASVVEEMSPILLIDIEGGSLSLRNTYPHVHRLRVKSFNEMQKVYESLAKGETEYKTVVLDSLTEIQKFCHSEDTEVLTADGWKYFFELSMADRLAQYHRSTGTISFAKPQALQEFDHTGDMIRVGNRTSGLLVTPNHRMLVGGPYYKEQVVLAEQLHDLHYIPKAGILEESDEGAGPTADEARVLAAFQADGFVESRQKFGWEFVKERKAVRLRTLLDTVGASYYERSSREPRYRFVVERSSVDFIDKWMPTKEWSWDHILWPAATREAVIGELRYWDGSSKTSDDHLIYLTSIKSNADVIATMCTLTGRSSYTVKCDDGTYRVQSTNRSWRSVNSTSHVPYHGKVYCATVPSGFMVTRREGKVDISGNSMERIMSTLMQKEPDRDPDVPGMREWGKNIEQIRRLVRAFRDLPVHVIFTALAMTDKDARTGLTKTKPSLSGKLSGEVAAFVDIVAYYYLKMVKGEQKRVLLTTGTEGQTAKDRTGLLPPVIEDPTMGKLYEVAFAGHKNNDPDAGKA